MRRGGHVTPTHDRHTDGTRYPRDTHAEGPEGLLAPLASQPPLTTHHPPPTTPIALRTRRYASPELLTYSTSYTEKIDLWGLGLIVYIMLTGEHPFEGADFYGDSISGTPHTLRTLRTLHAVLTLRTLRYVIYVMYEPTLRRFDLGHAGHGWKSDAV